MQDLRGLQFQLTGALVLILILAIRPARGQEEDHELQLLRRYVEQPLRSQLRIVAALQAQADQVVEPYMKNPALVGRREQAVGPGDGYSTTVVGAEFAFDIAGRQRLRQEAGEVRSQMHVHRARDQLLRQVCVVRSSVLDLDYARQRLAVLQRIGERYQWLLESVKTLAAGKEKSRFDVRRAELILAAHAERVKESAAVRDALHRELGAIVDGEVPDGLNSGIEAILPEFGAMLDESKRRHPAMAAVRVLRKAVGLEEQSAEKSWIPDLGLYGAYRVDSFEAGQDPLHGYEFGFSVDLPVFRKGQARESQALASSAAVRLQLDRTWDSIRVRVARAHSAALVRLGLIQELKLGPAEDFSVVWDEGVRAYREGVVVLGELVELLQAEQERALARERIGHEARRHVLEMYCAAGYFPEHDVNNLITGDAQ